MDGADIGAGAGSNGDTLWLVVTTLMKRSLITGTTVSGRSLLLYPYRSLKTYSYHYPLSDMCRQRRIDSPDYSGDPARSTRLDSRISAEKKLKKHGLEKKRHSTRTRQDLDPVVIELHCHKHHKDSLDPLGPPLLEDHATTLH
jgi:hypothetical protein